MLPKDPYGIKNGRPKHFKRSSIAIGMGGEGSAGSVSAVFFWHEMPKASTFGVKRADAEQVTEKSVCWNKASINSLLSTV